MTDARFPERWLTDRRVLRLSADGFRLFVIGLAWSASNRTDGVLDIEDIAMMPAVQAAKVQELEKAELWKKRGKTWLIVDFASTQTSRSEMEALEKVRQRERVKKAQQRATSRGQSQGQNDESPGDVHRQGQEGQERLRSEGEELGDDVGEVETTWPDVTPVGHPVAVPPVADWAMDIYDRESR